MNTIKTSINDYTENDDAPPSPSLSTASSLKSCVSWMQKSPTELFPMLKNAYSSFKDKERDLKLAAEIRKSLLENNRTLKNDYEQLLSSYSPYPTPSHSSSLLIKLTSTTEEEQCLKYVPPTTREALVEILEKKNHDLSCQLETVLSRQESQHTKKARHLENQVEGLQTSPDHATTKIHEMTTYSSKSTTVSNKVNTILTANSNTCSGSCTDLRLKMDQLKLENDHVNYAKAQIENKLLPTLHDLRLLKQQLEDFKFTAHDHAQLGKAFDAQHLHITELKNSFEEHRHVLAELRERNVYLSAEEEEDTRSNLWTEQEDAWLKHQTPLSSSSSLYSQDEDCSTTTSILFQPFQAIYNQLPNVDTAVESIHVQAGVVEKDALDDALSLIGRLENEYDHKRFLLEKRHLCYKDDYQHLDSLQEGTTTYLRVRTPTTAKKPTGLIEFIQCLIKSMITMTWRWFRFTLIMTIAVFMSLKEGPNALSL